MWTVYIIECADKSLYTGISTDISRRLKEHNSKKGGNYTQIRTPVKLVYQEPQPSHSSALKREAQIKRWAKRKKPALIKGDLTELSKLETVAKVPKSCHSFTSFRTASEAAGRRISTR